MLEDEPTGGAQAGQPGPGDAENTTDTSAHTDQAAAPAPDAPDIPGGDVPAAQPRRAAKKTTAKRAPRKAAAKKAAPAEGTEPVGHGDPLGGTEPAHPLAAEESTEAPAPATAEEPAAERPPAKKATKRAPRKTAKRAARAAGPAPSVEPAPAEVGEGQPAADQPPVIPATVAFLAPEPTPVPPPQPPPPGGSAKEADAAEPSAENRQESAESAEEQDGDGADRRRRRRGRRGRGRNRSDGESADRTDQGEQEGRAGEQKSAAQPQTDGDQTAGESVEGAADDQQDEEQAGGSRRRRRRRRRGSDGDLEAAPDDPADTVVRVRETRRNDDDDIQGVKGSTRIEAKRQRRREGREHGRRRPPIITEAEFLARREAVNRVMVVREVEDRTQIAVLEDDVLVEHYVTKASATSYAGNVYLGRVQNVLPSMEAAFVDIGKGRNAVLYAGEVNWDTAGMNGKPRKIEDALKPGQSVLVQVTKDPIAHKGARLTSQVSLPGRFLVYVPEGSMTGISRKLPDTERKRLKDVLKRVVPEDAGVIVRTAAEGASEEDLARDVRRLQAQWEVIAKKASASSTSAPALLYAEPDLAIRVVRDVFNEDFDKLVVQGGDAWETLQAYVDHVAPDLADRLARHTAESDVFADLRIDEQLMKALDRKVWLPSGGSLVIDRTEAMTVIDVNTGKFTGQGGNLEETVTRNNLEAAEEIVRQLRLRDIGGMIVVDFIDMVLESNRDLVLRRLTECLGRDRTKHQVAEVTSLGLVQMTRKRVGQGLLEAFSETCEVCNGRGVIVHTEPVADESGGRSSSDGRRKRGRGESGERSGSGGSGGRKGRGAKPQPPAPETAETAREPEAVAPEPAENEPADRALAESPADVAVETAPAGTDSADVEPEDVASAAARAAGVPAEKVENSASATEEPQVEPAQVRRRSRRRAASRPPGPPVGVP